MPAPAGIEIAVFAKAPLPGHAKTRLIPRLGAEGAARLQAAMTRHAVETALAAGLGAVTLWCDPDCSHPSFVGLGRTHAVALRAQLGGDLGARMGHAARWHASRGAMVLIIGTDAPALGPDHLRIAANALLAGDDVVVFPAEDGGYVLIGLRAACAGPFESVEWGTERVMAQTGERLRVAGLRWSEPVMLWDVDRPQDLDRLSELEDVQWWS
jgi:rSAM/selenodomain-associated transferase 1